MLLVGLNIPWFGGAYGHDLGQNQARPGWPVWYQSAEVDRILSFAATFGVRHLRIWLFEDDEGLIYDEAGRITGLDPTFESNLRDLTARIAAAGMRVYWTLLDANAVRFRLQAITFQILTDPERARQFCGECVSRVAPILAPVAWAVDLCNEPEAIIAGRAGNGSRSGRRWRDLKNSLRIIRDEVSRSLPRVRISIGSGYRNHLNIAHGVYDRLALDLDFYDFHCYTRACDVPRVTADKPIVLGELGCPLKEDARKSRGVWLQAQQRISRALASAAELGYEAVFLWFLSAPEHEDAASVAFAHEPGTAMYALRELTEKGIIRL